MSSQLRCSLAPLGAGTAESVDVEQIEACLRRHGINSYEDWADVEQAGNGLVQRIIDDMPVRNTVQLARLLLALRGSERPSCRSGSTTSQLAPPSAQPPPSSTKARAVVEAGSASETLEAQPAMMSLDNAAVGLKCMHPRHGLGEVVSVDDEVVTVDFEIGQTHRYRPASLHKLSVVDGTGPKGGPQYEWHTRPLWALYRRYTVRHPAEVLFHVSLRQQWFSVIAQANYGQALRDTLFGGAEATIVVCALVFSCAIALATADIGLGLRAPIHALALTVDLTLCVVSIAAVIMERDCLACYAPVRDVNLNAVVKSTFFYVWGTKQIYLVMCYNLALSLVAVSLKPLVDRDSSSWLLRLNEPDDPLPVWLRALPVGFTVLLLLLCLAFISICEPFVARLAAHSGSLSSRPVLPPGAENWTPAKTLNALVDISLRNPCLRKLYEEEEDETAKAMRRQRPNAARTRSRPGASGLLSRAVSGQRLAKQLSAFTRRSRERDAASRARGLSSSGNVPEPRVAPAGSPRDGDAPPPPTSLSA